MDDPVLKALEVTATRKTPEPVQMGLTVSNDVVFAVGFVTLQWAAFYNSVLWEAQHLRRFPQVPKELATAKVDQRQESNLTSLRKLGAAIYAGERDNAAEQFDRNLARAFTYKAERDKLAHGSFYLSDNHERSDHVIGTYKDKKFKMSLKRLQALGELIARCHGLLASFSGWVHAPERAAHMRAWIEKHE